MGEQTGLYPWNDGSSKTRCTVAKGLLATTRKGHVSEYVIATPGETITLVEEKF